MASGFSKPSRGETPGERAHRRGGILGPQHVLQCLEPVGFARRLVPAQPADAREAHRDAGLVPRRALQSLERDFEHQALVRLMHHLAHRAEALDRIAPYEAVDLQQLLVGEAEIGLADRHQFIAVLARRPHPECIVRIIR